MRPERRIELCIFFAAFFAFAYFNQGGGWNQNARFAEVRAMVEEGTPSLDHFLVYERSPKALLRRIPTENGALLRPGKIERLAWSGSDGMLLPVDGKAAAEGEALLPMESVACSGDVSWARGHFHPNKPPGASFFAVPVYWLLLRLEGWRGISPDDWRSLVVNAWLVSAGSVALVSALGCVVFWRLACRLAPGRRVAALAATWTFALGTLYFPFATLLFDHDLTAALLLAAFYGIARGVNEKTHSARSLYLSGLAAGLAAISNYIASAVVVMLGVYLLASLVRAGRKRGAMFPALAAYLLGVLGPLAAICVYNVRCFGSPFALSNSFQNPLFRDTGPTFLGMFGVPDPGIAVALLFSPFRGVFYSAPVLAMGLHGLWRMWKTAGLRAECVLIAAVCALFFLVNISFYGWHAGFSCGPRYLIPALPFLALPMVLGWAHFPKITAVLAIFSVAVHGLFTAVDAESPVGTGSLACRYDRPQWMQSPLTDYSLPLFTRGQAWPLLEDLTRGYLENEHIAPEAREQTRAMLLRQIPRGSAKPFLLAAIRGPVSVNPIGVYEGNYFTMFPPGSRQTQWNSFNAGELIFPRSRWSLLPLGLVLAGFFTLSLRAARE